MKNLIDGGIIAKFVQVKFTGSEQAQVSPSGFEMLFMKVRVGDLTLHRSLVVVC